MVLGLRTNSVKDRTALWRSQIANGVHESHAKTASARARVFLFSFTSLVIGCVNCLICMMGMTASGEQQEEKKKNTHRAVRVLL